MKFILGGVIDALSQFARTQFARIAPDRNDSALFITLCANSALLNSRSDPKHPADQGLPRTGLSEELHLVNQVKDEQTGRACRTECRIRVVMASDRPPNLR